MQFLLIIGCGDIGRRVARLLPAGLKVRGLARSQETAAKLRAEGITPIMGDLDHPATLKRLAGLAPWVLHLAPPPLRGERDDRTRRLIQALTKAGMLPQRLVYISTSGVYGDCHGALVDETRPVRPQTARAKRRVDAEQQLRHWAGQHGVFLSILRVPGIYAENRLPLERLRTGLPALTAAEDSYTNHIHADDLARAVALALFRLGGGRIVNVVDDSSQKMGDFFDLAAGFAGLPHPPRVSRLAAGQFLTPAMLSFLDESRRMHNRRLKRELKLSLRYPTVADCLIPAKTNMGASSYGMPSSD